ncbi:hypothetical protein [Streptomyces sp. NPDC004546]|uniref:hypothetical protein n=1 Tax=Streptomyces sp. NPDC004546 TaxID=3154282 RepID=UPI0033B4615C
MGGVELRELAEQSRVRLAFRRARLADLYAEFEKKEPGKEPELARLAGRALCDGCTVHS